jgi:DnaJ-domain-containing protein 1
MLPTTTFAAWTTLPWRGTAKPTRSATVQPGRWAPGRRRGGAKGKPPQTEPPPRYNALAIKALLTLELGGDATPAKIKSRYKELVKRHHPDANGGDRSSEERLREIIQAYNFLRANKLV